MVNLKNPSIRYGHIEGLTQICYNDDGKFMISCGYDGEVRIWKEIDDDDPTTITTGEKAYSVATQQNSFYVATDNHAIECYCLSDGSNDGILLRFTGNATYISVSESKKLVAAGSSDFDIKVINIDTKKQKCYLGHQAPILCVALDPNDEYLASTSCDGTLKLWDIQTETCTQTIPIIPSSNDVGNTTCLARLCWRPATGEDIAIAVNEGIKIFSRVTWELYHLLKTEVTKKPFQCCAFSPCGGFIAGATSDGWIVVWDAETQECIKTVLIPMKSFISSIMWNPRENNSLAFSDARGQVGVLTDVITSNKSKKIIDDIKDLDALFEEEDDNLMVDMMAEEDNHEAEVNLPLLKKRKKGNLFQSDDEDDKASKASADLPPIPSTLDVVARFDDDVPHSPPSIRDDASVIEPPVTRVPVTTMQAPFQSGSTPLNLSHRFMVWNSIGIVRAYNDETENAIDVEFHDTRTHHSLHINNIEKYTMADLSDKALILACEVNESTPSHVKCVHFSSWDSNKEWTLNMPQLEVVQAVTIGEQWFAVCTDAFQVRLLSLGGVQRQIFSIPGPVVTMAAHTDQLLIVYHLTQGFENNQCLGCILIEVGAGVGCKPRNIVSGSPFPISPKSTLAWLGFTAEGTPASVDSSSIVRLMNRKFAHTWMQVADMKQNTKNRHDHYWIVGLHESPQQIRCILCKGSIYPATLPRPTLTVLNYSIPLCEMESEKTKFEEEYWRTCLLSSFGDYLTSRGYEPDHEARKKSELQIQHTLMKLFALCCKTDFEFQAYEVGALMPTSASVNLAIKYASRVRKIMLAQRLQEVSQDKIEEERKKIEESEPEEEEMEEEEDYHAEVQAGYSTSETEWGPRQQVVDGSELPKEPSIQTATPPKQLNHSEIKSKPARSLTSQLSGSRRNPFKKSDDNSSASISGSILDKLSRVDPFPPPRIKNKPKESAKKTKVSQSTIKVNMTSTPKQKKTLERTEDAKQRAKNGNILVEKRENTSSRIPSSEHVSKSGVHLFIDEKLDFLRSEHPDVDEVELRKMAIKMFRTLSSEEKQKWSALCKESTSTPPTSLKRKLDVEEVGENVRPRFESPEHIDTPAKKIAHKEDSNVITADSSQNTRNRLQAFAYATEE